MRIEYIVFKNIRENSMKKLFIILILILLMFVASCGAHKKVSETDEDTNITETACTEAETRCQGDLVQKCVNMVWKDGEDCSTQDKTCLLKEGAATCVEKEVEDSIETEDNSQIPDVSEPDTSLEDDIEPYDEEQIVDDDITNVLDEEQIVDDDNEATSYWIKQWGTGEGDSVHSLAIDSSGNMFVTGYTVGSFEGYTNVGKGDAFLTKWNSDGIKAWTKQWGSPLNDYGQSVAVDREGNVFVTGNTADSLDGHTSAGAKDAFLIKWNSDGKKAWTKQWGSPLHDYGESVVIDRDGNIFVIGNTYGNLDGNTNVGTMDIFLTKWNSDGTKAWTKQWSSPSDDPVRSVAIGSYGNIFVTGDTFGDLDGNTNAGANDIFLIKCNTAGTKVWTKLWGTSEYDYGRSVAVDSSGNIFVTGSTYGDLDGNVNAGTHDIFLTKWNADGTKAWTKLWGTPACDSAGSVAIDSSGNVFVAGATNSDLDGQKNAGSYDVFLTKWNADGTKAWTKLWGTPGNDLGSSVATDRSGNVFIVGVSDGSFDGNTNAGSNDLFLIKTSGD